MGGGDDLSGGRVRILSDLHLGHPGSLIHEVEELRPLLEGVDTVVFNGDTCELSRAEWAEGGNRWLGELKSLCADVGVRPVFLTGNHDSGISEQGWLDLLGGAMLVTHGDMVPQAVAPWSREYLARKREVAAVWAEREDLPDDLRNRWEGIQAVEAVLHVPMPPELQMHGRWQLLSAVWPPERPLAILAAWITMFAAAGSFLRRYRPRAQVMIFGHFHRAGVVWRDGCLLVNTGAFMNGASVRVVDLEGERFAVRRVERDGDRRFVPGGIEGVFRIS